MNLVYETDRLLLKVLHEDSNRQVLDFLVKNQAIFEPYEPQKPPNYYTASYQKAVLSNEYAAFLRQKYLRLYVYLKNKPSQIIGTISFNNIKEAPFSSCMLGYKFDQEFHHQGYASESLVKGISIIFKEFRLHRIEAYIMSTNTDSLRLIERMGFHYEGSAYHSVQINDKWETHRRYALINYEIE